MPAVLALRAAAALGLGLALALLVLAIPDPRNLITVANPVESLFMWTDIAQHAQTGLARLPLVAMLGEILAGFGHTLALRTVVLHPDGVRQTVVFDWIAAAGAVAAWRRGDRRAAAQIGVLLLTAWGFESLSGLRGFKRSYVIYSDPLIVLAAALAVARWRGTLDRLWSRPDRRRMLAAAVVAYGVSGLIWPVVSLHRGPGPRAMCAWQSTYMRRVEPFPTCFAEP